MNNRITAYWPVCLMISGEWYITAVSGPEQLTAWLARLQDQGALTDQEAVLMEYTALKQMEPTKG
jgi:hypothetical protein